MTNSPRPSLNEARSEPGRLARLEQNMAVMQHRLTHMEKKHESVPTRVTKLEQQFEHMAGQLSELNEGQQKLTGAVSSLGTKITWTLAVASTLWGILQMIGPLLLHMVVP